MRDSVTNFVTEGLSLTNIVSGHSRSPITIEMSHLPKPFTIADERSKALGKAPVKQ